MTHHGGDQLAFLRRRVPHDFGSQLGSDQVSTLHRQIEAVLIDSFFATEDVTTEIESGSDGEVRGPVDSAGPRVLVDEPAFDAVVMSDRTRVDEVLESAQIAVSASIGEVRVSEDLGHVLLVDVEDRNSTMGVQPLVAVRDPKVWFTSPERDRQLTDLMCGIHERDDVLFAKQIDEVLPWDNDSWRGTDGVDEGEPDSATRTIRVGSLDGVAREADDLGVRFRVGEHDGQQLEVEVTMRVDDVLKGGGTGVVASRSGCQQIDGGELSEEVDCSHARGEEQEPVALVPLGRQPSQSLVDSRSLMRPQNQIVRLAVDKVGEAGPDIDQLLLVFDAHEPVGGRVAAGLDGVQGFDNRERCGAVGTWRAFARSA